jgi:four helix bundle protein
LLVPDFHHEKLEVYQTAIDFLAISEDVANGMQRGRAYVADQLRRAALSIVLNIAEGAGEFAPADKARFYRFARRSATECVAVIDASRAIGMVDPEMVGKARELLRRIVGMLTTMVLRIGKHSEG